MLFLLEIARTPRADEHACPTPANICASPLLAPPSYSSIFGILPLSLSPVMSRKRKSCPEPESVCESWSKTEQYKVKGRHLWTIDDFMRRAQSTEVGDSLCSPVFAVTVEGFDGETQNLTFQLEVGALE